MPTSCHMMKEFDWYNNLIIVKDVILPVQVINLCDNNYYIKFGNKIAKPSAKLPKHHQCSLG